MDSDNLRPADLVEDPAVGNQLRRKSSAFGNLVLPARRKSGTFAPLGNNAEHDITLKADVAATNSSPAVEAKEPEEVIQSERRSSVKNDKIDSARRGSVVVPPPQVPEGEEEGDFARQLRLRTAERKTKLKMVPRTSIPSTQPVPEAQVEEKAPKDPESSVQMATSSQKHQDAKALPLASPKSDSRRGSDVNALTASQSAAFDPAKPRGSMVPTRPPVPIDSQSSTDLSMSTRLSIVDGFAVRRKSTPMEPPESHSNLPPTPPAASEATQNKVTSSEPGSSNESSSSPFAKEVVSAASTSPATTTTVLPTPAAKPKRRGSMTKVAGFNAIAVEESFQRRGIVPSSQKKSESAPRALGIPSSSAPISPAPRPSIKPTQQPVDQVARQAEDGPDKLLSSLPELSVAGTARRGSTEGATSPSCTSEPSLATTLRKTSIKPTGEEPDKSTNFAESTVAGTNGRNPGETTPTRVVPVSTRRTSLTSTETEGVRRPSSALGSSETTAAETVISARRSSTEGAQPLSPEVTSASLSQRRPSDSTFLTLAIPLPPRRASLQQTTESSSSPGRRGSASMSPQPPTPTSGGERRSSVADRATMLDGTIPLAISSPSSSRRSSLASDIAVISPQVAPQQLPSPLAAVMRRPSGSGQTFSLESSPVPSRRGSLDPNTNQPRPSLIGFIAGRRRESSVSSYSGTAEQQESDDQHHHQNAVLERNQSSSSLDDRNASSERVEDQAPAETQRRTSNAGDRDTSMSPTTRTEQHGHAGEEQATATQSTEEATTSAFRPHLQSSFSLFSTASTRRFSNVSSVTAGSREGASGDDQEQESSTRRRSSFSLLGSFVRVGGGPKRAAGEEDEEEEGSAQSAAHKQSPAASESEESSLAGGRKSSVVEVTRSSTSADHGRESSDNDRISSEAGSMSTLDESFLSPSHKAKTADEDDEREGSVTTSPTKKRLSLIGGLRRRSNAGSNGDSSPSLGSPSAGPTEDSAFFTPPETFVMEITEEERRSFEATQARKDSQTLLKQLQAKTAKTMELASLEVEFSRIQCDKAKTCQETKEALESNLMEQEETERQIQALRQKKKALQVQATDLEEVLTHQQMLERKAEEDRKLAQVALDQAQKEKQDLMLEYQQLQSKFPEKIKPVSARDIELHGEGEFMPSRSRRLTFPLPVHSPSPAPPLVLRGLFQLKKDPNIDKIAGPNKVSSTTRQVLFTTPPGISAAAGPSKSSSVGARAGTRPDEHGVGATSRRSPDQPPLPAPPQQRRRPSLLNALQTGVNLKKVPSPEEKRRSLQKGADDADASGGVSMVMSRLVKQMNARRGVLEEDLVAEQAKKDDLSDDEWA